MANKNKTPIYIVPSVYGELEVKLVSRATMRKRVIGPKRGEIYNGLYINEDHVIMIAKELHGSARVATLLHEMHHAVIENTLDLDEEAKCDVIGAFYYRLHNDPSWLGCLEEVGCV